MAREIRTKEEDIMMALKLTAPGTSLREGLENILRAKTGGLIVIGDDEEVLSLVDGGFYVNTEFSTAYLYELAKMDGAIILSSDIKKILYANAQLIPDPSIPSSETGIRHRTAERVARQTGLIVISISQRRNIITIYKGYSKHVIQDTNKVLTKANQAIQTLERYKQVLDQSMINLSALEFEDLVTLHDVATVLQRTEMVMRIVEEIEKFINELGTEGRLVNMQLEELLENVVQDGKNVIRDYMLIQEDISHEDINRKIKSLTSEELLDLHYIGRALGYSGSLDSLLDMSTSPKGYRILNKIPRIPMSIVQNVIKRFQTFQDVLRASIEELDDVEGIGEVRARAIKEGLRRVQEQVLMDRHMR